MAIFEYRGMNRAGKNIRGVIEADNSRAARVRLKKDGIYVVDLHDKKKASTRKSTSKKQSSMGGVNVRDLALMTRQLATLIKANIPLVDTLNAVSEQVDNPTLAEVMSDCKSMVNEGSPFFKALAKYPQIFDKIYISMCEAGEMSGTLDVILLRLAEFTEAQNELRQKVKGAMTYPVLMMVVTLGLLTFLFIFVIPKMVTVFESAPDLHLPWYTILIIHVSDIFVNDWFILFPSLFVLYIFFASGEKRPRAKENGTKFRSVHPSLEK